MGCIGLTKYLNCLNLCLVYYYYISVFSVVAVDDNSLSFPENYVYSVLYWLKSIETFEWFVFFLYNRVGDRGFILYLGIQYICDRIQNVNRNIGGLEKKRKLPVRFKTSTF